MNINCSTGYDGKKLESKFISTAGWINKLLDNHIMKYHATHKHE